MLDLRSVLQSILALYGFGVSPPHRRRAPTCIGRPGVGRMGGLSRS